MIVRDAFDPSFRGDDLWFTFVLGLAFGLVAAGALLTLRRRREWWAGAAIAGTGLAAGVFVALSALDQSPFDFVPFRMKPYASELAEATMFVAVAGAGAAITGSLVLGGGLLRRRLGIVAGTVAALAAVGLGLVFFDSRTSRGHPRHPEGTDTSHTLGATRIIEGLELPTGLAVAANGDIAVIELERARFSLYTAASGGFEPGVSSQLPVPEGGLGLHVAFHPAYPDQPYVYVTAQGEHNGQLAMNVLRGRISNAAVDWSVLVSGLPTTTLEDDGGDHFGSAIAICGESLFVTTGDTEPGPSHHLYPGDPGTIRHNALQLANPIGKVFRYQLDGAELRAAGLAEGAYPVYAFGFRNPFGIACDPTNVLPIVADNGPEGRDQIRPVYPGTNHEWPFSLDRDLYVRPYLDSGRARLAPTGVATRDGSNSFQVIFSAFNAQALYLLPVSEPGPGQLRLLREVEGGAMAVAATAGGCVYFTDVEAVWRLDDGRCP